MFFVKQKTNQCGLHAIQNMLKSAKITKRDLHQSCEDIEKRTGDRIYNHESFGGDWSVHAVLQTLVRHGYEIEPAVSSKNGREWVGPSMQDLLKDDNFRGMIVHQPLNRHFTCLRPEETDGAKSLYYIDSQSSGPIPISPNLASRRCLAAAYMWEPYIVKGPEMEYVKPSFEPEVQIERPTKRAKRPSEDFMKAWHYLKNPEKTTKPGEKEPPSPCNLVVNISSPEDGDI